MRKLISLCLAVIMLVCLTACGDKPAESNPTSTPVADNSDVTTTTAEVADTTITGSEATDTTTTVGGGKNTTATTEKKVTTTAAKTPNKNYTLKASDFIRDPSVWETKYAPGYDDFTVYGGFGVLGPNPYIPAAIVEKSIKAQKLGEAYFEPLDGTGGHVGEWGYSFLCLDGHVAGDGTTMADCGWIKFTPKNDKDALAIIRNWLFKQFASPPHNLKYGNKNMSSINGHTLFQHYAGEFGFANIGSEIGENTGMHQAHMAFTRGAGRQYGATTIMDFSNWNQLTIGTEETYSSWGKQGFPEGGHSHSLIKRAFVMSYMGGSSTFMFEAACRMAFYGLERVNDDGILELTNYGKNMQQLVAFSEKADDIGYAYTPIGIAIDFYHGRASYSTLSSGAAWRMDKAFGYFDNTAGDDMNINLMKMLYPGSTPFFWNRYDKQAPEEMHQVNNEYGDNFDYITHNASQKVLNSYPVLLLCGDIAFSTAEAKRYVEYVNQGGTLICNTAYLKYFDSFKAAYKGGTRQDIKSGKGTVIVYGPDYSIDNLGAILKEQIKKFIPFTISDDIQYLVNVKDGSLFVTLINNEGVTKVYNQAPVTDKSKAKTMTVTYTGNLKIKQVKELFYGSKVSLSGKAATVTVGPGDVQVLEFVFD
ncbi:MAG: hypothetical protein IJ518_06605 [Clostridia bacterium]|nr:hypothetical protein [Clostridia bacterium]